jgi:hypothetical protein
MITSISTMRKLYVRAINIFLVCKALGRYFLTQRKGKIIGLLPQCNFFNWSENEIRSIAKLCC